MKKLFTLLVMVLLCAMVMAQVPQKFMYQAVVRNVNNTLVVNQNVSARISILQGSAAGAPMYVETHMVATNDNGLLTLEIGSGNVVSGSMDDINWEEGPFFLKSEIDPDGGVNYSIEGAQQLVSVPYALYAEEAGNGFSGNYNDLMDRPTNVSAFTNDAGYLTTATVQEAANIPTNVSAFTNDAGYITMDSIPEIPVVPTNVSAFTNDAGYITSEEIPAQPQGATVGDLLYWDGTAWVVVPAGQQGQQLVMDNGVPTWQNVPDNSLYYIRFEANGGTGSMNAQFFPNNVAQTVSSNTFVRNGYMFVGWNTAADGTGTSYAPDAVLTLTQNIILYAQWTTRVRVNLPEPCGQSNIQGE